MLGIIYTTFSDMVIEREGMAFWNAVLEKANPVSEGAYTTAAEYDDAELFQLITTVSRLLDKDAQQLVRLFGEYLFAHLMKYCPVNLEDDPGLIDFLASIQERVHDEVRRVHPNAYTPSFDVVACGDHYLTLHYRSERRLCALCEGLIQGASLYFSTPVTLLHDRCLHRGDDYCRLQVRLSDTGREHAAGSL
ncbi:MAG: heme NO-binding domain-containing protein [Hahellaceae bacterium]|nr:heme NO-binding domain-containing protein [Hahellaceae bacterium]